MNPVGAMNALGHMRGSCMAQNKDCPNQSFVKTLDTFLATVQHMKDTVMVPSRLQGVPYEQAAAGPNQQKSVVALTNTSTIAANSAEALKQQDLLRCYKILDCVRNELVNGSDGAPAKNVGNVENVDQEQTEERQSISAFIQEHLRSLFQAFHQLTDVANNLTRQYQEQFE